MASFLLPAPGLPAHSWNLRGPWAWPSQSPLAGKRAAGEMELQGNRPSFLRRRGAKPGGLFAAARGCGSTEKDRRSRADPGKGGRGDRDGKRYGRGNRERPCPFRLPLRRNGCPKPFILNIFLACWRRPGRQSALPNGHSCPALNTSEYLLRTRRPSLR